MNAVWLFLRKKSLLLLDKEVLKLLLSRYGIESIVVEDGQQAQELYEKLQGYDNFEEIEACLRDCDEMGHEEAIDRITAFANDRGINLPSVFHALTNDVSKSLWLFFVQKTTV